MNKRRLTVTILAFILLSIHMLLNKVTIIFRFIKYLDVTMY